MSMPPPPPPPTGPPPGPYGGVPGYGQVPNAREHPDGTTVLVLGILGLVLCGLIAPFAWVKGNKAKAEMDAQPQVMWTNRGAVTAGRICGIIGSILIMLAVAVFIFAFVLVAAGS